MVFKLIKYNNYAGDIVFILSFYFTVVKVKSVLDRESSSGALECSSSTGKALVSSVGSCRRETLGVQQVLTCWVEGWNTLLVKTHLQRFHLEAVLA